MTEMRTEISEARTKPAPRAHRGRPRHGIKLVRKGNKPEWYVQFYDEPTGLTRRLSTRTANRREGDRFLAAWRPPELRQDASEEEGRLSLMGVQRQAVEPAEIFNAKLCRRVHTLRLQAGLSQAEVARALGVGKQSYIHWEKRSPLPVYLLLPFAKLVGVDVQGVLTDK